MAAVEVSTLSTIALSSVIAAVVLLVILYIGFKSKQPKDDSSEKIKPELEEKHPINGESKDKTKHPKGKRGNPQLKNHPRQFAILKGHTGDVFDLEFSLNGKYMASTSLGCLMEKLAYFGFILIFSGVHVHNFGLSRASDINLVIFSFKPLS